MRKLNIRMKMQRLSLVAGLLLAGLLVGCPEKPKPGANSGGGKSADKSPDAEVQPPPPGDEPAAVAALEELGCKLTRNDAGNVTGVAVGTAELQDADLVHLKGLPALVDLDLAKSPITDDGLAILESLPQLKALGLQRCNLLTNDGLKHLEHVPNLERLRLLYTLISNDGMDHVAKLKKLRLLDLRGAKVSNDGIAKLSGHPSLVDLKLRAVSIDDDVLPHIATIKQLRSLEAEDAAIIGVELGALAALEDLQKLNLLRTYVSEVEFEPLSVLAKLRDLRLRGTAVRATVLNSLVASKDTLVYLDLTECPISDDELVAIEPFQSLETLEMWQTSLGDAGLTHLGKLANLKSLNISKSPNVTSAGVAELLHLANLTKLNLSETGIDDAALETLSGMKTLESLDVGMTGVTDEGVAKFQAALPECKVTR